MPPPSACWVLAALATAAAAEKMKSEWAYRFVLEGEQPQEGTGYGEITWGNGRGPPSISLAQYFDGGAGGGGGSGNASKGGDRLVAESFTTFVDLSGANGTADARSATRRYAYYYSTEDGRSGCGVIGEKEALLAFRAMNLTTTWGPELLQGHPVQPKNDEAPEMEHPKKHHRHGKLEEPAGDAPQVVGFRFELPAAALPGNASESEAFRRFFGAGGARVETGNVTQLRVTHEILDGAKRVLLKDAPIKARAGDEEASPFMRSWVGRRTDWCVTRSSMPTDAKMLVKLPWDVFAATESFSREAAQQAYLGKLFADGVAAPPADEIPHPDISLACKEAAAALGGAAGAAALKRYCAHVLAWRDHAKQTAALDESRETQNVVLQEQRAAEATANALVAAAVRAISPRFASAYYSRAQHQDRNHNHAGRSSDSQSRPVLVPLVTLVTVATVGLLAVMTLTRRQRRRMYAPLH
ncbi:hypothetical protein DIPPA_18293 [Diplonema papillatum]|nr:hypothetical protein DIPPA_18293 [Diplonema papillatum]